MAIIDSQVHVYDANTPKRPWHIDTLTIAVTDAPRPDEIVVVVADADGGRPHPRVGKGRAVV